MPEKVNILRYAQLVLKQVGAERLGLKLSEKEAEEMKNILQELQMTGEEVLELAAESVTNHFEEP